jgi:hypothetical protein
MAAPASLNHGRDDRDDGGRLTLLVAAGACGNCNLPARF